MKLRIKSLNNKGFAVSSIMYIILVMAVLLLFLSLSLLGSRHLILEKIKKEALDVIYNTNIDDIMIYQDNDGWSSSKKISITGLKHGMQLQYRINTDDWININSGDSFTLNKNALISARFNKDSSSTTPKILLVNTIDSTEPIINVEEPYFDGGEYYFCIEFSSSDSESKIKNESCEYGLDSNYGYSGNVDDGECCVSYINQSGSNIEGLYYYKISTTNNAGLSNSVVGSFDES